MSDSNPPAMERPSRAWLFFLIISAALVLRFLWAVIVPGGGWPLSPVHYMHMAADLLMTVGVFGLRAQLGPDLDADDGRRRVAGILFPAAVISGIGLLVIRFTSDAAWWTGHLYN